MKFRCRRTRSRVLVSTTTTTTTMIMTCAANRDESLLRYIREYVPDLIPTTKVLNLLIRCYSNFLGPPRPGEGGGGDTEEQKPVGYLERALSLPRDMKLIRDQADSKETSAAANDKEEEEEDTDNDDWDGNVGKTIQEEGERGGGGGSGRSDKGGSAKDGSYDIVARESTQDM